MITPMIVLFLLGALQGLVGWLMVKSGLVPEKFYVGHVELTTHLIAAIVLLFYTAWFAYSLLPVMQVKVEQGSIRFYIQFIFFLLFFQLIYGGFMAGLKAAAAAPTWPDINGLLIPLTMNELSPWTRNLVDNPITVHFIHRGFGYALLLFVILYFFQAKKIIHHHLFKKLSVVFLLLFIMQVLLGILTVLNATNKMALVWLGVSHQFIAMIIVLCGAALLFLSSRPQKVTL